MSVPRKPGYAKQLRSVVEEMDLLIEHHAEQVDREIPEAIWVLSKLRGWLVLAEGEGDDL